MKHAPGDLIIGRTNVFDLSASLLKGAPQRRIEG
jgi:hypothetical protein